MNKAEIIGCLVGLSVFVFSICIKPEATCHDGWKSPSIGKQGACSHHGGVDYKGEYPLIGIIAGIFLGRKVYHSFNKEDQQTKNYISKPKFKEDIETAINTGRKIVFLYKRPQDKTYQARTIKPIGFIEYQHSYGSGATFCVKGICDLMKAERTFALKRMKDLKIV